MPSDLSILFLTKDNDDDCKKASEVIKNNFSNASIYFGEWGKSLPSKILSWNGDYILSYLSRWIIPDHLIKRANSAAINFHPASPNYPGIGCNNFALYEGASEYGVTCHHMATRVDTGRIIAVKRFPIFESDTVETLLRRTYDFQIVLFYEIMDRIINNKPLPSSDETWTRKPFTRKDLNELCKISPTMSDKEIARRIRATSYGAFQPTMNISGYIFELQRQKNKVM